MKNGKNLNWILFRLESEFIVAMSLSVSLGLKSGSSRPNTDKVGKITRAQLEEIAKTKEPDLTAGDLDAAVRTVAGTARSMGIDSEGVN